MRRWTEPPAFGSLNREDKLNKKEFTTIASPPPVFKALFIPPETSNGS